MCYGYEERNIQAGIDDWRAAVAHSLTLDSAREAEARMSEECFSVTSGRTACSTGVR